MFLVYRKSNCADETWNRRSPPSARFWPSAADWRHGWRHGCNTDMLPPLELHSKKKYLNSSCTIFSDSTSVCDIVFWWQSDENELICADHRNRRLSNPSVFTKCGEWSTFLRNYSWRSNNNKNMADATYVILSDTLVRDEEIVSSNHLT